jgi:hypothetical protein
MANMKATYTDLLDDITTFIDNYIEALGYIPAAYKLFEALSHLYNVNQLEIVYDDVFEHISRKHAEHRSAYQ